MTKIRRMLIALGIIIATTPVPRAAIERTYVVVTEVQEDEETQKNKLILASLGLSAATITAAYFCALPFLGRDDRKFAHALTSMALLPLELVAWMQRIKLGDAYAPYYYNRPPMYFSRPIYFY